MSKKIEELKNLLRGMKSVLLAYSGGVDSTFLLKVSADSLGDNVLAVIAESPTYPDEEVKGARELCEKIGVRYLVIQTDEFSNENFVINSKERCYYCKRELFSKLLRIAKEKDFQCVMDGSNYNDKSDFRPGKKPRMNWA